MIFVFALLPRSSVARADEQCLRWCRRSCQCSDSDAPSPDNDDSDGEIDMAGRSGGYPIRCPVGASVATPAVPFVDPLPRHLIATERRYPLRQPSGALAAEEGPPGAGPGALVRVRRRSLRFAPPSVRLGVMSLPTTLADAQFRDHFHACAFLMGPAEERAIIEPFFVEGMRRGEKAVYIVDPKLKDHHEARLAACVPSPDLLEVTTWNDAHLKGGSFDPVRMMASLDEMIRDHAATGRPPMRLVGQMGWVFSAPPGIEQLVAYEASVNEVLNRGKTPTVCVYDVRQLSGSMMMDLLRAHPLTVMNGVLQENPFYTPADEMLRDIQRRRSLS